MGKKRRRNGILATLVIALAVAAGLFLPAAVNDMADRRIEEVPRPAETGIVNISSGTELTMIQRLRLVMSYNSIRISAGSVYDTDSARDRILEEIEKLEELTPDPSWRTVLEGCDYDGTCLLYVQSDDTSVSAIAWDVIFYLGDDYGSLCNFTLDEETGKILSASVYAGVYEEYISGNATVYDKTETTHNTAAGTDARISPHTLCQEYADYLGVELMELYQGDDYGDSWYAVLADGEDSVNVMLYYFWDYGFSIGA